MTDTKGRNEGWAFRLTTEEKRRLEALARECGSTPQKWGHELLDVALNILDEHGEETKAMIAWLIETKGGDSHGEEKNER